MQEILIKAAVMHLSSQRCVSLSVCTCARVCVCVPVRVCVREATTTITTKNNNNNKSCPITSDANLGSNLSNQPPTIQPTVLPWRKQTHASVRILISQLTHGIHHTDTLTKADIF